MGLVLHLKWREEDGTLSTIDVDLNCPTWPTHARFDGSLGPVRREVPLGWLEEHSKLEDMTVVATSPHLLDSKSWPVKFRLINRDTVLPGQTLLFMNDGVISASLPWNKQNSQTRALR